MMNLHWKERIGAGGSKPTPSAVWEKKQDSATTDERSWRVPCFRGGCCEGAEGQATPRAHWDPGETACFRRVLSGFSDLRAGSAKAWHSTQKHGTSRARSGLGLMQADHGQTKAQRKCDVLNVRNHGVCEERYACEKIGSRLFF